MSYLETSQIFYERQKLIFHDDPEWLKKIEADKAQGIFVCPYMFASPEWYEKSSRFFSQKDLQNIAIDPEFDVLVTNKRKEPIILLSVGIEIAYAKHETFR